MIHDMRLKVQFTNKQPQQQRYQPPAVISVFRELVLTEARPVIMAAVIVGRPCSMYHSYVHRWPTDSTVPDIHHEGKKLSDNIKHNAAGSGDGGYSRPVQQRADSTTLHAPETPYRLSQTSFE